MNRGNVVVCAKEAQERKIAKVLTRKVRWRAIFATASESSSNPCSRESTPASIPTRAPTRNPECARSEEHTSELQSQSNLVCRLLLEKKKKNTIIEHADITGHRSLPSSRGTQREEM